MDEGILAVLTMTLVGCGGAGLPGLDEPVPPAEIRQGLYRVTVTTHTDECDPPRLRGDAGITAILTASSGISVGIPTAAGTSGSWNRYDLPASKGYFAVEGFGVRSGDVDGCSYGLRQELQLLSASPSKVEISSIEDWTVEGCTGPPTPGHNCRADQLLEYRFVKVCANPVRLVIGLDGKVDCL